LTTDQIEEIENINLIQKAKGMLPNIPDEVFNTWLLPIIRDHNSWPYLNILSVHPSEQWRKYFGLFTLYDVSNLFWDKVTIRLASRILDPVSNDTIKALIGYCVDGLETPARNVRNCKMRFDGFVQFINRTGTIPAPIIGINTFGCIRILDGNHRLAALKHLGLLGNVTCETWLGHP
jgi:hypothetical protein